MVGVLAEGVSVHLVGTAAFKAVEALYKQRLVGSIPIHSRAERVEAQSPPQADGLLLTCSTLTGEPDCRCDARNNA